VGVIGERVKTRVKILWTTFYLYNNIAHVSMGGGRVVVLKCKKST